MSVALAQKAAAAVHHAARPAQGATSDGTRPTALVVGPMKCGTTWIHDYLAARGDVCLPHLVKETFYFDRHHDRGPGWYAERFAHRDPARHRAVIEVAPSLFHRSDTLPAIIRAELGDIPIVVTLRDPVARAWSHYRHMRRGYTRKPLQEAVAEFPEILSASQYARHLPQWQAEFSRVTVLRQGDLASDPGRYTAALCDALGLPPHPPGQFTARRSNAATEPRWFWLARLGRKASRGLRRAGFYGVVDLARRAGLKQMIFGQVRGADHKKPDPSETAFLISGIGEPRSWSD